MYSLSALQTVRKYVTVNQAQFSYWTFTNQHCMVIWVMYRKLHCPSYYHSKLPVCKVSIVSTRMSWFSHICSRLIHSHGNTNMGQIHQQLSDYHRWRTHQLSLISNWGLWITSTDYFITIGKKNDSLLWTGRSNSIWRHITKPRVTSVVNNLIIIFWHCS